MTHSHTRALPILALLFFLAADLFAGEGFGMMKKAANLTRVSPPQVFLTGTRIAVKASGNGSKYAAAAARLQSQIESELLGNNPRLKLDPAKPETVVDVKILQSDYSESWENREGTRQVKTGQKDSKGKDIWRTERVTIRVQIVNYMFSAAFKIFDARDDRSLGADTIQLPLHQEFVEGRNAPDAIGLENNGIRTVVADLVRRLAPTKEIVGVLLPKGSFENANAFADAGLWSKYLESLEKIQPLSKPTDEAYRQYALGVAYEALGYGADDVDTTLKYLEQASVHYNNAVETHPKESYFTKPYQAIFGSKSAQAPIGRVQAALVQYQRFKEFADSIAARPGAGGSITGAKGGVGGAVEDGAMTNEALIEMLRAGLPEEVILTSVDTAPKTAFDVSPRGLIQLSEAKASKKILQRVQAAAAAKSKPSAKSSSTPNKTATKKP